MDSGQFDRLTRALARSQSRRETLQALLGISGAAVLATAVTEEAGARGTTRTRFDTPPTPQNCPTGEPLCSGACCPAGSTCCSGSCCAGTCSDGLCCDAGGHRCGDQCCSSSDVCCGSVCCSSIELCSSYGNVCCPGGTSVCGQDCCYPGTECCDNECCNGACYGEERCCPVGREVCNGGCCAAGQSCCGAAGCCDGPCSNGGNVCCDATSGTVCGDDCCVSGLTCCNGTCVESGATCCDPSAESVCGDSCCGNETQRCCSSGAGIPVCIPVSACCDDVDCGGIGSCAGTCNQETRACDYFDSETLCGTPTCSSDGSSVESLVCNGAGECISISNPCDSSSCLSGECLTTCAIGDDCPTGVCNNGETCCPERNTCFEEFCCIPDEANPGFACCPAGSGCCDCFVNDRFGGPFCCGDGSTKLCRSADGDWRKDVCIDTTRYTCVGGRYTYREWVCDNDVFCDKPCCGGAGINSGPGGTCCEAGTECSHGECVPIGGACQTMRDNSIDGCRPGEGCTVQEICADDEACFTKGTCCPNHRLSSMPSTGAQWGDSQVICCDADEAGGASCTASPFCRMVPDTSCTSIYSWSRR